MPLATNGVPFAPIGRAAVAEQVDEEIGKEVGQEFLFLEAIGPARAKQIGPVLDSVAQG